MQIFNAKQSKMKKKKLKWKTIKTDMPMRKKNTSRKKRTDERNPCWNRRVQQKNKKY